MKYLLIISSILFQACSTGKVLECGDLLERYGERPSHIQFIECKKGTGQVVLEAHYTVPGENSIEVGNFFMEKYAMAKMKFACCGWEATDGKNGFIRNVELEKIHPAYVIEISMYGNAEKLGADGEIYLEKDSSKVEFEVVVSVLDI